MSKHGADVPAHYADGKQREAEAHQGTVSHMPDAGANHADQNMSTNKQAGKAGSVC